MIVFLSGELGAGKTTLVRGILRALGYRGRVKSPTFSLVELYTVSSLYFYHFDFYRFKDPQEIEEAGLREHFGGNGVCLVEWPERAQGWLPAPDLGIHMSEYGGGRLARLEAHTERGSECLSGLA